MSKQHHNNPDGARYSFGSSVPLNGILRRMAYKYEPARKPEKKTTHQRGLGNRKLTDDQIYTLLKRIIDGETILQVARSESLNPSLLYHWWNGENRAPVRARLEKDFPSAFDGRG